jgi:hypothetical protein
MLIAGKIEKICADGKAALFFYGSFTILAVQKNPCSIDVVRVKQQKKAGWYFALASLYMEEQLQQGAFSK